MRFATVFLTGAFAAFASAQSPTTSAYAGQTSQQAAIAKCLAACESGDVNCTSKCIAVPNPDAAMVNETNRCVAACPKGNGSAAESKAYGECMQGCIDKNFFTSTGTPSVPTAGAGVGNGNGNGNGNDNGNGNGGDNNENKPTGTGTDGTPTGTGTAAQNTNAAVKAGAGMVGLAVMGLLAL
ncbi:hypothetical protein QBC37DRAFT_407898 [Rhypophila decipiens]|uniref:Uncharacterized protein n=1 Tax=Rhypophila decipiens TaxID=261697 RepID=A0AAN6YJY1_9PEZI|nr:hypothetical protein QBC37DRAFT_407898 [Rhypophila decipiens]